MLATDRPLTKAEIDAVRDDLRAFVDPKSGVMTQKAVSNALRKGFSEAVISDFIRGKSGARDETIARKVNNLMEVEAARASGVKTVECVDTNVALEIFTVCRHVHKHRRMGTVVGPSGVGKTITFKACQHKIPSSIYIHCTKSMRAPGAFIRTIAKELGEGATGTTHAVFERVVKRLKSAGLMLILDEGQRLSLDTLEMVRDLHDLTRTPIVLGGTYDLPKLIEDGDVFHGQFTRRVAIRLNIVERFGLAGDPGSRKRNKDGGTPLYTTEQVVEVLDLKNSSIRFTGAAINLLTDIANTPGPGSLGLCEVLLESLSTMKSYATGAKTVDPKVIRATLEILNGVTITEGIETRVRETRERKTA